MATILREGKALQSNLSLPQQQQEEIVEECIKDVDGRVIAKNKYVKGKFLGKVEYYFSYSFLISF
jgi:hypothetical protein